MSNFTFIMHIYNLKVVLKLKAMQITQNYGKKNIYFFNCRILQDLQDSPWHPCVGAILTSASTSSVDCLRTMADDTATPNSKKAKASPTQRSRSPTNPLWSSHKFPSRSVLSQLKRGGSKTVMPHAIFVYLRRPPLPPPRVRVRMPFPLLQVPSEL